MSKLWRGRDDAGKQIPSPPGSSLRLELHFRNGGPSISGMNHTALEDKLGYRFNNPDLLVQALTHPSTDSKPETRRAYERLEFLGDAILQLAVTQYLYHHMPQSPEGELTQLRARTSAAPIWANTALSWGWINTLPWEKGKNGPADGAKIPSSPTHLNPSSEPCPWIPTMKRPRL